jgi:CO/xanthine dehydrogenase Mo-binding subunit
VPPQPARFKEVGIHRNMAPIYDFPQQVLRKHFVAQGPFRTSAMRSLGAFANVFAIESFMDEIAACLGEDPVQLRLRHLRDASATALLERLQEVSRDHPCGAMGRGVALARYKNQQTCCAVMVDLDVTDAAEVRLARVWIFADAGLVIDSDGLRNQLEGGFVQAASWTLKEAVTWDRDGVTSRDWEGYPILRFSEVPEITTELMDTDRPAVGAGEAASGPTPAAIANALYAATGLRVRDLPLTPERLREVAAH